MKRRDLERHLRARGARLLREGGNHSFWGFDAERSTAVPRHREIDFRLARKICTDIEIPPPTVRADPWTQRHVVVDDGDFPIPDLPSTEAA